MKDKDKKDIMDLLKKFQREQLADFKKVVNKQKDPYDFNFLKSATDFLGGDFEKNFIPFSWDTLMQTNKELEQLKKRIKKLEEKKK